MSREKIFQVSIENRILSLKDLENIYLPMFDSSESKGATIALLKLVHKYCTINPFDSTINYPDGSTSESSLGQLLRFFICGENISEMPLDALTFQKFLKHYKFSSNELCMIKM